MKSDLTIDAVRKARHEISALVVFCLSWNWNFHLDALV